MNAEVITCTLSAETVLAKLDEMRSDLRSGLRTLLWLRQENAHLALGLGTWEAFVEAHVRGTIDVPPDQRQIAAHALREGGMTQPEIAVVLGTSVATVSRTLSNTFQDERCSEQSELRDALSVEWYQAGYVREQIARALRVGNTTVEKALARAGVRPRHGAAARRVHVDDPTPPPEYVVPEPRLKRKRKRAVPEMPDEPKRAPITPTYLGPRSILAELHRWRDVFESERWALRAVHDVDEASAAGDTAWLENLHKEIAMIGSDFMRLRNILDDPKYRLAQSRMSDGKAPSNLALVQ